MRRLLLLAGSAAAVLAGCMVGPDYTRPDTPAPSAFRASALDTNPAPAAASGGDLAWREVFRDPQLRGYIAEALGANWDLQIAAARVLQAEASARVARSQFWPTVAAGGDAWSVRGSERGPTTVPPGTDTEKEYADVFLAVPAYELDFWGRIRRASEAARARLLATEEARRTVRQTVVAQVAAAYIQLLELDRELAVSYSTLGVRSNSLALTTAREAGGVASLQDVMQAKILVSTAEAAIQDILRQIEQKENELSLLLGRNPGPIARGEALSDAVVREGIPAGLPSSMLERRPDIRAAEQQLIAANADIGQAKAAFFPQITLTGTLGYQATELGDLFSSPAQTWQFGPAVSVPLFTGGRLRGNLDLAKAVFEETLAQYRKTVQGAFREVSDALIGYQRTCAFRARQMEGTEAHRKATELANTRYEGGVTSYLEVLYNEQELFTAELRLAQAQGNELLGLVQIYRALGGGAEPAP